MESILTHAQLKEQILLLEIKQVNEKYLIKDQVKQTLESLKPSVLIKNTIKGMTASPDFKHDLLNTSISIAAGFLTKKVAVGGSHNPLKQLLGTLLQVGITSLVSRNADDIRQSVSSIVEVVKEKFDKKKLNE